MVCGLLSHLRLTVWESTVSMGKVKSVSIRNPTRSLWISPCVSHLGLCLLPPFSLHISLTTQICFGIFNDTLNPMLVSLLKTAFPKRITFGMSFHTLYNRSQFVELHVITHSQVLKLQGLCFHQQLQSTINTAREDGTEQIRSHFIPVSEMNAALE